MWVFEAEVRSSLFERLPSTGGVGPVTPSGHQRFGNGFAIKRCVRHHRPWCLLARRVYRARRAIFQIILNRVFLDWDRSSIIKFQKEIAMLFSGN